MLGGFKIGDVVIDVYSMDEKFVECISDEDFIFYDRQGFIVEIEAIHVELLC